MADQALAACFTEQGAPNHVAIVFGQLTFGRGGRIDGAWLAFSHCHRTLAPHSRFLGRSSGRSWLRYLDKLLADGLRAVSAAIELRAPTFTVAG
jgi:hypothetical protein